MAVVEHVPKIHGRGTTEAAWRQSPWLAALPLLDMQALLAQARRLVVVSPHPDDEVLGCGGAIASACRRGLPVVLVAVTDGEACYPGDAWWTPQRLRQVRRQELERAAQALGVGADAIVHLGVADGGVAAQEPAIAAQLVQWLQPGDLLLTTWRDDGHPDHEATARACIQAAAKCGATLAEFPVWAWHWLSAAGADSLLPAAARHALPDAIQQAKRQALTCFASQLGRGAHAVAEPILPPHVLERFERGYEVFLR